MRECEITVLSGSSNDFRFKDGVDSYPWAIEAQQNNAAGYTSTMKLQCMSKVTNIELEFQWTITQLPSGACASLLVDASTQRSEITLDYGATLTNHEIVTGWDDQIFKYTDAN